MPKAVLMQGNVACVEGAIAAGMRFFAGYPITPSTEVAEAAADRLPKVRGAFIQMEDEISSMAAVIGASVSGVKSMTATSGPGFSLKQENIGYAAMAQVPCVIVNVQRSGPSTGLPTSPSQADVMQARWGTHGDHPVIALSPSSVREAYDLAVKAFNLSEEYRTPVILLMDEIIGHLREGIVLPDPDSLEIVNRRVPTEAERDRLPYHLAAEEYVPVMPAFFEGKRYNITGLVYDESGFPSNSSEVADQLCTRLMEKIDKNADRIIEYEQLHMEDAEIAVFCYGGTARGVSAAVDKARATGIKAGIFRALTVWPFAEEAVAALSKKVKHILVAEHNYGQMVYEVERAAKGRCAVSHIGKVDGTVMTPAEILVKLEAISRG